MLVCLKVVRVYIYICTKLIRIHMHKYSKYLFGTGCILLNMAIALPTFMVACVHGGSPTRFYTIYNIPLIPGYILIGVGFGKYAAIANIIFQNTLYIESLRW